MIVNLIEIKYLVRIPVRNQTSFDSPERVSKVILDNKEIDFTWARSSDPMLKSKVTLPAPPTGEIMYFEKSFYFSDAPYIGEHPENGDIVDWQALLESFGGSKEELQDEIPGIALQSKINVEIRDFDGSEFASFGDRAVNIWVKGKETRKIFEGTVESFGFKKGRITFSIINRIRELEAEYSLSEITQTDFPNAADEKIGQEKQEIYGRVDRVPLENVDGKNRIANIDFVLRRVKEEDPENEGAFIDTEEIKYYFESFKPSTAADNENYAQIKDGDAFFADFIDDEEGAEIGLDESGGLDIEVFQIEVPEELGDRHPSEGVGQGRIETGHEKARNKDNRWLLSGKRLENRDFKIIRIVSTLEYQIERSEEVFINDLIWSGTERRRVKNKNNDKIILDQSFRDVPRGTFRVESIQKIRLNGKTLKPSAYQIEIDDTGTSIRRPPGGFRNRILKARVLRAQASSKTIILEPFEEVEVGDYVRAGLEIRPVIGVVRGNLVENAGQVDESETDIVRIYIPQNQTITTIESQLIEILREEDIEELTADCLGGLDGSGVYIKNPIDMAANLLSSKDDASFKRSSAERNYRLSYLLTSSKKIKTIVDEMNQSINGYISIDSKFRFVYKLFEINRSSESVVQDEISLFEVKSEGKQGHESKARIKLHGEEEASYTYHDLNGAAIRATDMQIYLYEKAEAIVVAMERIFYRFGISQEIEYETEVEEDLSLGDTTGITSRTIKTQYGLKEIWGIITRIEQKDQYKGIRINSASGRALTVACFVGENEEDAKEQNIAQGSHFVDDDSHSPIKENDAYAGIGVIG